MEVVDEPKWPVSSYSATLSAMTVSAIPPKYQRGIGIMWIVMVVLGLIVAIGRNFVR
jgi:hypothetical protein